MNIHKTMDKVSSFSNNIWEKKGWTYKKNAYQ